MKWEKEKKNENHHRNEWMKQNKMNWSEMRSKQKNTQPNHFFSKIEQSMPFIDFEKSFVLFVNAAHPRATERKKNNQKEWLIIISIDDDKEWMLEIRWLWETQSEILSTLFLFCRFVSFTMCSSFFIHAVRQYINQSSIFLCINIFTNISAVWDGSHGR